MNGPVILALREGQPDLQASLTTYTEMIHQQGFPATHAQLLRELKAWFDANPALQGHPKETLQPMR